MNPYNYQPVAITIPTKEMKFDYYVEGTRTEDLVDDPPRGAYKIIAYSEPLYPAIKKKYFYIDKSFSPPNSYSIPIRHVLRSSNDTERFLSANVFDHYMPPNSYHALNLIKVNKYLDFIYLTFNPKNESVAMFICPGLVTEYDRWDRYVDEILNGDHNKRMTLLKMKAVRQK